MIVVEDDNRFQNASETADNTDYEHTKCGSCCRFMQSKTDEIGNESSR